jgi:thiamine-monophosphate kinase
MQTVGELGESGVLGRVLARLGDARAAVLGPGDDCAVLRVSGDAVVTTDTMIEGPDFRLAWHDGFELGWKLAATNLSDVAAMGAVPTALTLALAVPHDTPVALLERIAEGLDAACRTLAPGCGVIGGDLGRAPAVTAAVTAIGELEGRAPVVRAWASRCSSPRRPRLTAPRTIARSPSCGRGTPRRSRLSSRRPRRFRSDRPRLAPGRPR